MTCRSILALKQSRIRYNTCSDRLDGNKTFLTDALLKVTDSTLFVDAH